MKIKKHVEEKLRALVDRMMVRQIGKQFRPGDVVEMTDMFTVGSDYSL